MRNYLFLLLIIPIPISAQPLLQYDTITDINKAIKLLHIAITKQPNNTQLYYLLAKKKRLLTENDSAMVFAKLKLRWMNYLKMKLRKKVGRD